MGCRGENHLLREVGVAAGKQDGLPRLRHAHSGRNRTAHFEPQTLGAICREWLLDPLGATTLSFNLPDDKGLMVTSPEAEGPYDACMPQVLGHPAGGATCTLRDALKPLRLHLTEGVWQGQTLLDHEVFTEMHTVQYAGQIAEAASKGEKSMHEPWGLGWLLRGNGPACEAVMWFGMSGQTEPRVFGHAGIDTIIGVAHPGLGVAFVFNTTRSPKSVEETVRLRNEVTDQVFGAVEA